MTRQWRSRVLGGALLGAIGYENVTKKLAERLKQIESCRDTSLGADFPQS